MAKVTFNAPADRAGLRARFVWSSGHITGVPVPPSRSTLSRRSEFSKNKQSSCRRRSTRGKECGQPRQYTGRSDEYSRGRHIGRLAAIPFNKSQQDRSLVRRCGHDTVNPAFIASHVVGAVVIPHAGASETFGSSRVSPESGCFERSPRTLARCGHVSFRAARSTTELPHRSPREAWFSLGHSRSELMATSSAP